MSLFPLYDLIKRPLNLGDNLKFFFLFFIFYLGDKLLHFLYMLLMTNLIELLKQT